MAALTYSERMAAQAETWVQKHAEIFGFTVTELIEASVFASWEDCLRAWGHTGDALGYWKEAIGQAAYQLKRQRGKQDRQRERAERAKRCGGEVCTRCGGAGGHSSWPGWACFDCGGRGWL